MIGCGLIQTIPKVIVSFFYLTKNNFLWNYIIRGIRYLHHDGGSPDSGKAYFCLRMENEMCGFILTKLNGYYLQSEGSKVRIKTSHLILTWLD